MDRRFIVSVTRSRDAGAVWKQRDPPAGPTGRGWNHRAVDAAQDFAETLALKRLLRRLLRRAAWFL